MWFNQIIVVKETLHNEKRVALTPKVVAQLTDKGYRVWVEEDAGINAGFTNGDLAFHDAIKLYLGEKPLSLIVIGAGAAGISAA